MLNYSIVGNVITVFHEGKVHHISKGDIRYKKLFPLLKKGVENEEIIADIVNYNNVLDKDVIVKDGKFCLGKQEIEIRDDLVLVAKDNFKALKALVYNMENHAQFDKKKTVEVFLENKDRIIPFSKDGMRFLIDDSVSRDLHNTPFYKIRLEGMYMNKIIRKYPCYKVMMKEVFGFSGKKFFAIFDEVFFNEDKKEVNVEVINFLRGTKGYFDINKTQELLQEKKLYKGFKSSYAPMLLNWLKFYFPTNEKKAFNLLQKEEFFPDGMLKTFAILHKHDLISNDITISTLDRLDKEYQRAYKAYKQKFEEDEILVHFPELKNMDKKEVLPNLYLTYPKCSKDVAKWGKDMHNCFGGRAQSFLKGNSALFGLETKQGKLAYVFETSNGRMVDIEGRSKDRGERQRMGKEVKKEISQFLKKFGFIK